MHFLSKSTAYACLGGEKITKKWHDVWDTAEIDSQPEKSESWQSNHRFGRHAVSLAAEF